VRKGIFARPSLVNHPRAKLFDALQVVIERLGTEPGLTLAKTMKIPLDLVGGQIGPSLESDALDNAPNPRDSLLDVIGSITLGLKVNPKVLNMLSERLAPSRPTAVE
jgi:hypothetical protein